MKYKKMSGFEWRSFSRYYVSMDKITNLNFNLYQPGRGGAIMYTIVNDVMYFGFGRDAPSKELTDFGGGICYKTDLTALNGSIREFKEETLEITNSVGKVSEPQYVLYNDSMMILFVKYEGDMKELSDKFAIAVAEEKRPEVTEIVWLSEDKLKDLIAETLDKNEKIYSRVRNMIGRFKVDRIKAMLLR